MRNIPASVILLGTTLAVGGAGIAIAASPDGAAAANRYIMTPTDGGFVRMDTQTGILSFCTTESGTVSCKLSQDDRVAILRQLDQLKTKNKELKEENRRLEDMLLGDGKDKDKGMSGRKRTFKLPSEKEVDQALGYIERMYKKFRDKIKELETDKKDGTPL